MACNVPANLSKLIKARSFSAFLVLVLDISGQHTNCAKYLVLDKKKYFVGLSEKKIFM